MLWNIHTFSDNVLFVHSTVSCAGIDWRKPRISAELCRSVANQKNQPNVNWSSLECNKNFNFIVYFHMSFHYSWIGNQTKIHPSPTVLFESTLFWAINSIIILFDHKCAYKNHVVFGRMNMWCDTVSGQQKGNTIWRMEIGCLYLYIWSASIGMLAGMWKIWWVIVCFCYDIFITPDLIAKKNRTSSVFLNFVLIFFFPI